MKRIVTFLIISLILVIGCDKTKEEAPIMGERECTTDNDCVTGGCSGTICQSKYAEPIFTTCEYRAEYACYREINCGCINGKCVWEKTAAFDACVEKAGESYVGPVV